MNPDYNTLLRFYRAATGGYQNNMPMNSVPNGQIVVPQQGMQPQSLPQQNVLPPQNVIQVSGKASVDALRMSPNSSVLLMDTTQPIVWLCTSDGIGNVTSVPYDIVQHKDIPPIDMGSLENRVTNIESVLNNLIGGKSNDGESDASTNKSRKDKFSDGKSDKHKE